MKHPVYLVFGIVVILASAAAELRGWTLSRTSEARVDTPRSIRENPGAYRPIYRGTGGRYMRGK
jgi:hypothetical protein